MDIEIKTTENVVISPQNQEIIDKVGAFVELICGWDIDILYTYIAKDFGKKEANYDDLLLWVHLQVQKYFEPDVNIKGNGLITPKKEGELMIDLVSIDFEMCIETIVRKLRGLNNYDEFSQKWEQQMKDMLNRILPNDDEEEDEEDEEEE